MAVKPRVVDTEQNDRLEALEAQVQSLADQAAFLDKHRTDHEAALAAHKAAIDDLRRKRDAMQAEMDAYFGDGGFCERLLNKVAALEGGGAPDSGRTEFRLRKVEQTLGIKAEAVPEPAVVYGAIDSEGHIVPGDNPDPAMVE